MTHAGDHTHDPRPDTGERPVMDRAYWDGRYASADALWSGDPNPQLVTEVAELLPGAALDVGCGEGADAIWLAARGWRVTGLDLSGVALGRAQDHAGRAGDRIAGRTEWRLVDLADWEPEPGAYDLVSAQFVHLPIEERVRLHRKLVDAVAPGGTLLIVNHDPTDLDVVPRPPFPEFFATAEEVATTLPADGWEVLVAEARPRPATHPDGHPVTIHDAVTKARRRR